MADIGFASVEWGTALVGNKSVLAGLARRGLIEVDDRKSGYSSVTNTHVVFYKPTPKGEDLIKSLFGLFHRAKAK